VISVNKMKRIILHILKFCGIFYLSELFFRNKICVLCYHGVWLGDDGYPGDALFMSKDTFRRRMNFLNKNKYNILSLSAALDKIKSSCVLRKTVVITIDDGWYSTYKEMFPVLKDYGFDATLYFHTQDIYSKYPVLHVMARHLVKLSSEGYIGKWKDLDRICLGKYKEIKSPNIEPDVKYQYVKELAGYLSIDAGDYESRRVFGYVTPNELREMYENKVDIQLHTHNHDLGDFSREKISSEIEVNRERIADLLRVDRRSIKHFCYPSGQYRSYLDGLMSSLGVVSAVTCDSGFASYKTNIYYLPRILDGENLSMIEFEAELCGMLSILRDTKYFFKYDYKCFIARLKNLFV